MNNQPSETPSTVKKWLIAMRPWALPASTMPVIFGTSLAVVVGEVRLNIFDFTLAILGMVLLHSGANMLSDVFDFHRGLDQRVTPVSGALVRGWISKRETVTGAAVLFLLGTAIGLWLAFRTTPLLLVIGGVGVVIGLFYTGLKYHALGDLAVFLNFGILGSLGAWIVQVHDFSWVPVIWTVPMAMLVSAILHANNWRDAPSDRERRVYTVAGRLGDRGSLLYYAVLIFGPLLYVAALMLLPRAAGVRGPMLPWTFLLCLLALPNAVKLWGRAVRRHAPRRPMDFIILDGATSRHNLLFGLLCTAAVWFQHIMNWS